MLKNTIGPQYEKFRIYDIGTISHIIYGTIYIINVQYAPFMTAL